VDLITRQKITWQGSSLTDDGRAFEISALQPSDDPDVLQAVSEARETLIEQVKHTKNVYTCSVILSTLESTVLSSFYVRLSAAEHKRYSEY